MRCVIIGKVWPEPTSTAAGRRTCDLLGVLSEAGWEVSFASPAQRGEFAFDLGAFGAAQQMIALNDPAFDTWISEQRPDVVIFDRFMMEEAFGWRVRQQCPEALRVLDTSDLHCLRVAREVQLKKGGPLNLKNETALREIASIYRCDLTLVISDFEMGVLRTEFSVPGSLLAHWPFSMTLGDVTTGYAEREHFVMIGSLLHAPNLDASRWCLREMWPKIRRSLPEAEMHYYGSYGDRYARELHQPAVGFHFKGRADDALSTMVRYRVSLAPLRFGAGLKGKVFDAVQAGTPTVLSPIAAEGIFPGPEWAQESTEAMAREAVDLYTDPERWQIRRDAERSVCRSRFAADDWCPRLVEILRQAHAECVSKREANFTGRMLNHHQHRSSEYLSRWIEAKNQTAIR